MPDRESLTITLTKEAHYRTEDAIAAIWRDACAKLAEVPHVEKEFHHPYPHPKEPGLGRDHRAR